MITTTGLTRIYGKGENAVTAVNNLDIRIDDGELVARTYSADWTRQQAEAFAMTIPT